MADERWGENDHDKLIAMNGRVERLEDTSKLDNARIDTLMTDRAKLIGICVGIGALTEFLIRLFWPGAK